MDKKSNSEEKVWKQIHKVLSDFKYPKNSLLIFSLNFTLKIEKKAIS